MLTMKNLVNIKYAANICTVSVPVSRFFFFFFFFLHDSRFADFYFYHLFVDFG